MITIWLVGKLNKTEVGPLVAELLTLAPRAHMVCFDTLSAATDAALISAADIILVLQHRPYEFSPADIEGLLGSQPLARFIVGLGPWCASVGRSEQIWPESAVVPFYSLLSRVQRELAVTEGRQDPLPLTAGRDEAAMFDLSASRPSVAGLSVVVQSPDRALVEFLAEHFRSLGAVVLPPKSTKSAELVIWDLDPITPMGLQRLAAFRSRFPFARIAALTALPTQDIAVLAMRHGADGILPKLLDAEKALSDLAPFLGKQIVPCQARRPAA